MQPSQPQPPTSTPLESTTIGAGPTAIPMPDMARVKTIIDTLNAAFSSRVVGQESLRTSMITALMVGGHILLESVPGLAKTTAASTIAESISATFKRIQCTPDLLPSDIIGTQLYDYTKGQFKTQLGPVHANFVLLDEINRSSAKTQSAMLEAMQEKQTTIGGEVYKLPKPFIVLATQNPIEQEGTYELPEAQLDRFLLKEILSYPTPEQEVEVLRRIDSGILSVPAKPTNVTTDDILYLQALLDKVFIEDSVREYIVKIVAATREASKVIDPALAKYIQYGASPRASISFQQVARALALMDGRDHVIPEDVKKLRYSILRHRVILNFEAVADQVHPEVIIDAIFGAIQTP